ncbi:hypothetical protein [Curtobacterium sp. MCBD17_040]|uniref:hypothetical protein n=1 Tax=Curtobacterium sp. MCBD17_040 TaxID=2175674 RepID=UPI000DAA1411|nr:hypothetical protein [Curtobacterium sp. MCBD17_040]WIB65857.1 hypothetical protein DEI94_17230 [Curtobacterium sp. MCBD17_040]
MNVRRFFRSDRAATDPVLVIAAIAVSLILLVGGSFTVTAAIRNGRNLNAQRDLQAVAVAESAELTDNDDYVGYDSVSDPSLEHAAVGFTPTAGDYVTAAVCGSGANAAWIAAARSTSAAVYVASSAHPSPSTDAGIPVGACFSSDDLPALASAAASAAHTAAAVGPTVTNLVACNNFETGTEDDCGVWTYFDATTAMDTTKARFGSRSLRITQASSQVNGINYDGQFWASGDPEFGTYQAGDHIYEGAWVWVPKGLTFGFGLRSPQAQGSYGYGSTFVGIGGWQWVTNTYTVPSSPESYYDPVITMGDGNTTPPVGTNMWVDGVSMVHTHAALPANPAYISGDGNGWTWTGAAEESASTGPERQY